MVQAKNKKNMSKSYTGTAVFSEWCTLEICYFGAKAQELPGEGSNSPFAHII